MLELLRLFELTYLSYSKSQKQQIFMEYFRIFYAAEFAFKYQLPRPLPMVIDNLRCLDNNNILHNLTYFYAICNWIAL